MRTIQPAELASDEPHGPWSCRGRDIWDAFCAAAVGDAAGLRAVLARDPNLYRAEYWYTQPIHFAVREGQLEAVRVLLEAGADPGATALSGDDLLTIAGDRGYDAVVRLLVEERDRRGRIAPERAPPTTRSTSRPTRATSRACASCSTPSRRSSPAATGPAARRCTAPWPRARAP